MRQLKELARRLKELARLRLQQRLLCDTRRLRARERISRSDLLSCVEAEEWREVSDALSDFQTPEGSRGVNPGDGKALYSIVRYLGPGSILEIGTHIGASTMHMALAMHRNRAAPSPGLITVDVRDVNDAVARPWEGSGARHSPESVIERLGLTKYVSFVKSPSLKFLRTTQDRFDLVFLDGDHSAATVYAEVLAALRILRPDGCIVLHDYFPDSRPLWTDGRVTHGPVLAISRLRRECAGLEILPLGELPWPTKLGSRMTSLALVVRADGKEDVGRRSVTGTS